MLLNVNVTLLVPFWLTSLVIGRLGLWPIRRIVRQASTQPAESVACSASPGRASSNHVDRHRLSASPALTVSNKKQKKKCMITYQLNTQVIPQTSEAQCLLSLSSLLCLMCASSWVFHWIGRGTKSLPLSLPVNSFLLIQIIYCTLVCLDDGSNSSFIPFCDYLRRKKNIQDCKLHQHYCRKLWVRTKNSVFLAYKKFIRRVVCWFWQMFCFSCCFGVGASLKMLETLTNRTEC